MLILPYCLFSALSFYPRSQATLSYLSTITHLITIVYILPLHESHKKRAISLQKVHLWMDCGKRILWSWTQSKATKIRAATVQSSVWTLQQILPDVLLYTQPDLFIPIFCKNITLSTVSAAKNLPHKKEQPQDRHPALASALCIAVIFLLPLILKTIGSPPQSYHRHAV